MIRLFRGDAYIIVEMNDGSKIELSSINEQYGRRLSLEFNCPKTRTPLPNNSMVKIYNLSKTTRDRISGFAKKCFFYAGYPDQGIKLFAVGDVVFIDSRRVGPEWITEIRFGDGIDAFNNAKTEISLSEGEEVGNVINMISKDMGLALSAVSDKLTELTNGALTLDGLSKNALNTIAEDNGFDWSIQDEEIIIRDRFKATDNNAIAVNAGTGLFAGVQRTQSGVKFSCQLNPDLRPGKLVKLEAIGYTIENGDVAKFVNAESQNYDGFYLCKTVTAIGDNFGGRFDCEVEAEEYVL